MNKKNNKIIIPLLVLVAFIGGSVWTYLVINQLNRGTTNSVTKGFAHAMGIDEITSPTFTIIKEYVGELPLYHMDVYRLEDSHEDIGIVLYSLSYMPT
jgi:tRNA threonylcarbamoyl adenosine modification protein YjeE